MKLLTLVILGGSACAVALLTSCGSGSSGGVSENKVVRGYNPGVGPFDSNGNYVERWADDKEKGRWWRKGKEISAKSTKVAKVKKVKKPEPEVVIAAAQVKPQPKVSSYKLPSDTLPKSVSKPRPVVVSKPQPKPKAVVKAKPKPVSKPTVKVKPKRKAPIRYIVAKGDTLWSISQKYKTSVSAIKTANGLNSNGIGIGRALLIPQY